MAGCSDGEAGAAPNPLDGFPPAPRSYGELSDLGATIQAESAGEPFTDPASLPNSGGASLTGVVLLGSPDGGPALTEASTMISDLRLNADFGDESVPGLATNFVADLDERLDGDVTFSDGFIDRGADTLVDYTFGAVADGALTTPDGTDWEVEEGSILGDFHGSGSTAGVAADIDFVTGEFGGDEEFVPLDGIFDARRDRRAALGRP